jgi:long-subunit fatty acid transport protein
VNVKVGAIVRPVPELRLGVAYHSPTYFTMTDVYNASISSYGMNDATTGEALTPFYEGDEAHTDYQLKTPGLLMLSGAYQFGQKGFISLDWDLVDYREIQLKDADGYPYDDTNSYMYQDFRVASNLRLGGEYRLTDNVSLRGGAAWYQSPVQSTVANNNVEITTAGTTPQYGIEKDTYYLSCGVGYHSGGFFLDAALQRQMRNEDFFNFYDSTTNSEPKYAELSSNKTNLIFTFGFKF